MSKVTSPGAMNEAFARAFNSRKLENLLALYEPDAVLLVDGSGAQSRGVEAIGAELSKLLQAPGTMVSRNNFCVVHGDLALLRADFHLSRDGSVIVSGSTAEVIRKQADGSWLYIIDHAAGASVAAI